MIFKQTFSDIFKDSKKNLFANKGFYLLLGFITLIMVGINTGINMFLQFVPQFTEVALSTTLTYVLLATVLSVFFSIMALILPTGIFFNITKNEKSIGKSFRQVFKSFFRILLLFLILTIIMLIPVLLMLPIAFLAYGTVLAIIIYPLLIITFYGVIFYISVKYGFALFAVLFRNKKAVEAIKYSGKLVKDNWWRVFGYLILVGLIMMLMFFVAMIPLGIISTILTLIGSALRFPVNILGFIYYLIALMAMSLFISIFKVKLYLALEKEKNIKFD